jgi:hypothetical protein
MQNLLQRCSFLKSLGDAGESIVMAGGQQYHEQPFRKTSCCPYCPNSSLSANFVPPPFLHVLAELSKCKPVDCTVFMTARQRIALKNVTIHSVLLSHEHNENRHPTGCWHKNGIVKSLLHTILHDDVFPTFRSLRAAPKV